MVTRPLISFLVGFSLLAYGADKKAPRQKEVKVQKSSMSMAQEIELGKQAAAQVERSMEVVKNAQVEAWLNQIGEQLAKTPQANKYPYYFRLVNEDSINAFALPGGPMFVHTGLIKAADNEAQVAGVLAHEMSHVALRHGVSQMGRSQTWQTILGVAGAAAGIAGGSAGGLLGTAVNTGGSLGVGALLSKYSRGAENDADLNGARMLAAAGYNPLEMARFFEKLEAQMGSSSRPKGLDAWFSSHPSPGNRVASVSEDIRFYPSKDYNAETGNFASIKTLVAAIPPAKMKPAVALQPVRSQPREGLPSGFADVRTKDFVIAAPGGWQVAQAEAGGSLYVVPQGGVAKGSQGVELIAGVMIDYYVPPSGSVQLEQSTNEMLKSFQQGDSNLKVGRAESFTIGGQAGLLTRFTTRTSFSQDPEQVVNLYSVVRPPGLWTLVMAAPKSRFAEAETIFRQILQTVAFSGDNTP